MESTTVEPGEVEPINIPETAVPGSRLMFEGYSSEPDQLLNPKKKVWERLSADFKTNDDGLAVWRDSFLLTPDGEKIAGKFANCHIK